MTQVLFSAATTPQLTDLDANFTEVYGRTQLMTSSGTSAGFGGNASASTGSVTPKLWAQSAASAVALGAFHNDGTNNLRASLFADSTNGYVGLDADRTTGLIGYSFRIGGTERLRIDINGNLLVGLATASSAPVQGHSINTGSNAYWAVGHVSGTSSGSFYASFSYNGANIGTITQSGTNAVLYNTTSDQRLKDNIAAAGEAGSILDAVQVRQYDWKSDGSHQRFGFVAQELVMVVPEAVHSPADSDDMMAVDYSKLVPLLVKEIQSLRARLTAAGL